MNKYPKYKPSGIDWIGDIPEHWELKKLKYVVSEKLKYGANEISEFENTNDPRYIRITDFDDEGKLRDDTFKSLPFEIAKDYLLVDGDILFARSGATVGKTFQFKNYSGIACFAGYLIKASPDRNQIFSDFLYYFTKSSEYDNWKNSIFNQATIQNIGADKYNVLEIILPHASEQTAIASFLDEKTALIDSFIEKKKKLIELLKEERTAIINQAVTKGLNHDVKGLKDGHDNEEEKSINNKIRKSFNQVNQGSDNFKMKPSGIGWLGDIPEHWDVKKLKYVAEINSSKKNYEYNKDSEEEVIFLPMEKVKENGQINQELKKKICDVNSGFTYFEKNDIIVAKITPCFENGKGALLNNLETNFGFGSTEFHTLRPKQKLSHEFLFFITKSERFMTIGEAFMSGSAGQKRIPTNFIEEFIVEYPKIKEQKQIIDFIETETQKIDNTMTKIEKEIELMQEYRTALISEVVTGKVCII